MFGLSGIKFNLTTIVIIIVVLLILVFFGWYFYRQGKKQIAIQSLPGELPGNPGSGNVTGASNDEIKIIANSLFKDIDGVNVFGHNPEPYNRASLLSDTDLVKVYNTFNTLYQKKLGETLTQAISNEYYSSPTPMLLYARLRKLNCN